MPNCVKDYANTTCKLSKEFIEQKIGSSSLALAKRQQEQLAYFTQSKIQDDITQTYIDQWATRNYVGNDYFLNWVKTVFRTDNFLSFFKYYRQPNPASKLINNRIKEPLSRVFFAEDSYFKYTVRNQETDTPEEINKDFEKKLFDSLLFNHNAIVIHDLEDVNTPYRKILDIDKVVAINSEDSQIKQLAYCATALVDDVNVDGYLYMDAERYVFYDKDYNEKLNIPHDLGECPADYISKDSFANDDVVRESIFSYVREELEEYTFLKTLQRMTEPNGAIPVITKLQSKEKTASGEGKKGLSDKEPMSMDLIAGQLSDLRKEVQGSKSLLQTGSIIDVPVVKKNDGSIDIDLAKNFINFFYLPTEALEYLNKRIKEIEQSIIISILGDYSEQNDAAKNELQVSKSYVSKEDKLRYLSDSLTRIRTASDFKLLALKYGKGSVSVDIFYGSDFFLETQDEIYKMHAIAPNAIERKKLMTKLAQSRNRFSPKEATREVILYNLIPYASDIDFDKAITRQSVTDEEFTYQTRFPFWIGRFESMYGNVYDFWNLIEGTDAERLSIINDLIIKLIKDYEQTSSASASVSQ